MKAFAFQTLTKFRSFLCINFENFQIKFKSNFGLSKFSFFFNLSAYNFVNVLNVQRTPILKLWVYVLLINWLMRAKIFENYRKRGKITKKYIKKITQILRTSIKQSKNFKAI